MLNLITPELMANIEIAVWAIIGIGVLAIAKFATN